MRSYLIKLSFYSSLTVVGTVEDLKFVLFTVHLFQDKSDDNSFGDNISQSPPPTNFKFMVSRHFHLTWHR